VEGWYTENRDKTTFSGIVPAVHVPVGLALQLGSSITVRAEIRILDGFAAGGELLVNF
jgi:hypothetical protein